MIIDYLILLPDIPDLLIPSLKCNCPVKDSQLSLVAWRVSGDTSLQDKIPTVATKPIFASWRNKTDVNYNAAWKKWEKWCREQGVSPFCCRCFSCPELPFEEGKQYRSLNCYLSAISSTLLPIEGVPVDQHPLVICLLKAAFNLRPPKPRYSHTWDVSLMLGILKELGGNEELTLNS